MPLLRQREERKAGFGALAASLLYQGLWVGVTAACGLAALV